MQMYPDTTAACVITAMSMSRNSFHDILIETFFLRNKYQFLGSGLYIEFVACSLDILNGQSVVPKLRRTVRENAEAGRRSDTHYVSRF